MEFLKGKWAYVLLVLALIVTLAAGVYLFVLTQDSGPYAGGMLVKAAPAVFADHLRLAEGL